jgi:phosphatidylglycerophosphatase A
LNKSKPAKAMTSREVAFKTPSGFLAFGFGVGLAPIAPGTAGTLLAVPFVLALKALDDVMMWGVLAGLFVLGVWVCGQATRNLGVHDHGGIVFDEMLGYWLTVALVPSGWPWLVAGFFLFRFFDILKPWPIGTLDRSVPGGFGIMVDDVLAAAYSMLILELIARVL